MRYAMAIWAERNQIGSRVYPCFAIVAVKRLQMVNVYEASAAFAILVFKIQVTSETSCSMQFKCSRT